VQNVTQNKFKNKPHTVLPVDSS